MQPAVSIIIVTLNSAKQIGTCLSALARLREQPAHQIIVVDNGSQDDTLAIIQARHPAVRVIAEDENWGFAGGVRRGVAASAGEPIALLNPDAVPEPDWLERLVAPLNDAQIGVAGAKVLGPDGRLQALGLTFDNRTMLPVYRCEGQIDTAHEHQPIDVWAVHGAAMAFSRRVWEQLSGFDDGFFPAYFEETDFCERARRAGYRVVVVPQAVVRHAESTTTGKYSAQFYYYFLRNRLRYVAKWLDWPALWNEFRPAERARLGATSLLDRRVARLVYEAGVPPMQTLDAAERASILAQGRALHEGTLPDDEVGPLIGLLEEARANSVHQETAFRSTLPLVARLRGAWNAVATRWYVRPNLDQQTRYNLALQRALEQLIERTAAQTGAQALDSALLAWRLRPDQY
jgi:O-antigen biosynthesis protein